MRGFSTSVGRSLSLTPIPQTLRFAMSTRRVCTYDYDDYDSIPGVYERGGLCFLSFFYPLLFRNVDWGYYRDLRKGWAVMRRYMISLFLLSKFTIIGVTI